MGAPMRYQPQGLIRPNIQNPLLQGGAKLLALIVGSHISSNLVDGKPLSIAGTNVKSLAVPEGIGATNSLGQGDLSATGIEAAGGSIFVDFWYGRLYGTAASNAYFFGDYDGANGQGIASRHSSIGGRWGYFDGGALNDSGEALPLDGTLQCFVTVRDTVAGTVKVYRNGALKITSSGAPVLRGAITVGSIGPNQWATFYSESSTVLAGRLRDKAWDAAAVKSFTNNPWQLFQAPDEEDFVAAAGAAALAGAAAGVATGTGSLTTAIKLAGAASASASSTAALTTSIALTGAASATGTASGALGTAIKLVGQAAASASLSGALITGIPLAGSAAASSAASASLTTQGAGMAGQAVVASTATGALTTGIVLAGTGAAVATSSASVTTTPAGMAGSAAANASASASLTTAIKLAGAGAAQASAGASLGTGAALSGAASAGAVAIGSLTTGIRLQSAAGISVLALGQLTTVVRLGGSAIAAASANGALSDIGTGGYIPVQFNAAALPSLDVAISLGGNYATASMGGTHAVTSPGGIYTVRS